MINAIIETTFGWFFGTFSENHLFNIALISLFFGEPMGYRFDFSDVVKKYLVKQYRQWSEYFAADKTSLRANLHGSITQILEINKYPPHSYS